MSSALKHSPSARCVIAANNVCRFLDILKVDNVSFKNNFLAQILIPYLYVSKVKQSLYTPWRRLGGEEV
jgi:hypothetical protein